MMGGKPSVCNLYSRVIPSVFVYMAKDMSIKCSNHKECTRKKERWEELQTKFCPMGQAQLVKFVSNFSIGKSEVRFDKHFHKRSLERSITERDVKSIIEYGWVIERNKNTKSTSVVLLGYVGEHYRPLHVVFDLVNENMWVAVTAYNPQSHNWKWNDSFDARVCFCSPEDNE